MVETAYVNGKIVELPEIKRVKTAPENINLSRDEFVAKRRREKELAARVAVETEKIKAELEEAEDVPVVEEQAEDVDVVQTVKKAGRPKKY